MGSFNETCALSGMNIGYGTPVRLLFLTRNGCYRHDQRGVYHYDQWFARTPPIVGTYDDYGRAAFTDDAVVKLVAKCFDADAVERPWGYNQCHDVPVTRGKGLRHYLEAAWEGRLNVGAQYTHHGNGPPKGWPTWQAVQDALKKAGLPIMGGTADTGYTAQEVMPGIVCVTHRRHGNSTQRLAKAKAVLSKQYACRVIPKFDDRPKDDVCLIVTVKGAFRDPSRLYDPAEHKQALENYPNEYADNLYQPQSTLAVMIREDVWKAYCKLPLERESWRPAPPRTVAQFKAAVKSAWVSAKKGGPKNLYTAETVMSHALRLILADARGGTTPIDHLKAAFTDETFQDPTALDTMFRRVAELARVECVMAYLHQAWYVPCLGGQEASWAMRAARFAALLAISQKEQRDSERDRE